MQHTRITTRDEQLNYWYPDSNWLGIVNDPMSTEEISPQGTKRKAESELGGDKNDNSTKQEPGQFRLSSRQLFLTYPKCSLEKEDALLMLKEKVPVQDYIVAQEKHKVNLIQDWLDTDF